jgi:hypothetical protein
MELVTAQITTTSNRLPDSTYNVLLLQWSVFNTNTNKIKY